MSRKSGGLFARVQVFPTKPELTTYNRYTVYPPYTLDDLDELYSQLGMADENRDDALHPYCNPKLPNAGEAWDEVVARSGEWLDQAREAM